MASSHITSRTTTPVGGSVLRLRAEPTEQRRIQWAEDVIDNEGLGKKSSKVCCIYHKPRAADESSDEDSSDDSSSDSSSDSEPDNSTARPVRRRVDQHDHGNCGDSHGHGEGSDKPQKRPQRRKASPNAYEKMPKIKK